MIGFIVITRPRCGSSLLMQTLKILGIPVLGEKYRQDIPVACNPKGFYEDGAFFKSGLTSSNLTWLSRMDGGAVKVNMPVFTSSFNRVEQWRLFEKSDAKLIITYRHPLETALSRNTYRRFKVGSLEHFMYLTTYLRFFQADYKALAAHITSRPKEFQNRIHLVGFHRAFENPCEYVHLIQRITGLNVARKHIRKAVGNIDSSLYRLRSSHMEAKYQSWYEQTPSSRIYELIRHTRNELVWSTLTTFFQDHSDKTP